MDSTTLILGTAAFVILHPWLAALGVGILVYAGCKMVDAIGRAEPRWAHWQGLDRWVGPNAPIYLAVGSLVIFPVVGVLKHF
jgi:hypothetical protein